MTKKSKAKADRIPADDEQALPEMDLTPTVEATATLLTPTEMLRAGYVWAKHIIKGGLIQISAKQVGTVFKADEWEIVSDKKK